MESELILRNAISLLISGFLYNLNDIEEVPRILKEIASDYEKEIVEEME